ncbi:uncharacterized protein BJ171DRAFT_596993 [Polychytrium aggregatum]|uniref:uncharacterized protein n=1 Tax=Polychytrium aggregatum TaxID=110093 RepID=UPI0022FDF227|nr:uncharacterized protein BJ171DRAFT_596993 [Polychytrium aggregatum]KAI9206855.1 hypothetical protein BJ171DRAFT_596993 [Polychytrium aggregatum]
MPAAEETVQRARLVLRSAISRLLVDADPDMTAILLSGGLDTSIIAEAPLIAPDGTDLGPVSIKHAITVSCGEDVANIGPQHDLPYAVRICEARGFTHHILSVPNPREQLMDPAKPNAPIVYAIQTLQSFDPMEMRGGVAVTHALQYAASLGIKTVVTGDGADELFAGYSFLTSLSASRLKKWLLRIVGHFSFSAVPLAAGLGMRVIQPFLDPAVVEFALSCTKDDLVGPDPADPSLLHGKFVLREAFPEAHSRWRRKVPLETGAGTTPVGKEYAALGTSEDLQLALDRVYADDGIVLRDREHLHYFSVFEGIFRAADAEPCAAFELQAPPPADPADATGPLANRKFAHTGRLRSVWSCRAPRFGSDPCVQCGFQLDRLDQYFCKTCGAWPARPSGPPKEEDD